MELLALSDFANSEVRSVGNICIYREENSLNVIDSNKRKVSVVAIRVFDNYIIITNSDNIQQMITQEGISGEYLFISDEYGHVGGRNELCHSCKNENGTGLLLVSTLSPYSDRMQTWSDIRLLSDSYAAVTYTKDGTKYENLTALVSFPKCRNIKNTTHIDWLQGSIFKLQRDQETGWIIYSDRCADYIYFNDHGFSDVYILPNSYLLVGHYGNRFQIYKTNTLKPTLLCKSTIAPILSGDSYTARVFDGDDEKEIQISPQGDIVEESENFESIHKRHIQTNRSPENHELSGADKFIDVLYCFWGRMSWDGKQIKVLKNTGVAKIAHERILVVDSKKHNLNLCTYVNSIGSKSYLNVLASYEMNEDLCSFIDIYTLKSVNLYELPENVKLTKDNVSDEILKIIRLFIKSKRVIRNNVSTIIDSVQSVYDLLKGKGIPKENIVNSIFVLFPQLLDDKEIFPEKLQKLRETQIRLIEASAEKIDFRKTFDALGLSEEECVLLKCSVIYYIKVRKLKKKAAVTMACYDLGFDNSKRINILAHFSKDKHISDLKNELLNLICSKIDKNFIQELNNEEERQEA